jgi:Leu/Phe-tRNA-protein transferase
MKHKNDTFFNQVVAACKAKNWRDVMTFQKNWNNDIIAQFYATLYVNEHGNTMKLH